MSFSETEVQLLTELSLTSSEARVYITLCKYESLTVKTLSVLTKIGRPDVYRVLERLLKRGMIEKLVLHPTRFKAVPIEIGANILLSRKMKEINNLKSRTQHIVSQFKRKAGSSVKQPHKFILIPKNEVVVKKIAQAIDSSQERVDLVLTFQRFWGGLNHVFTENLENAWDRGVVFRFVVEKPENVFLEEKAIQFSRENNFCEVRFLPNIPGAVMGVYDRKSVFLILYPMQDLANSSALWSNSDSLLEIATNYFDFLWNCSSINPNDGYEKSFFKCYLKG